MPLLTPLQEAELCRRYQLGETATDLSTTFNIHKNTVCRVLERNGIKRRGPALQLTEAERTEVCREYLEGASTYSIAHARGISAGSVSTLLRQGGIAMRSASERCRRYTLNEGFFNSINSEPKAYWLGFLGADGCVRSNRLQVCLSSVDRAHLTKLAFYLETDAPVRDYFIGGVHRSEFQVTSNTLVEGLAAHGVVPCKTFILRWPNLLPDILLRHYLRGYVDGDGNFYSSDGCASFSLAGTQAFCLEARRYLASTLNLPAVRLRRNSKTWSLTYGGTRQVRRIQQFLYNAATVFLARKRAVKIEPAYLEIKPAKLKAFRRERGLTKTRLCEEAGVSYQTVYRIESGWIRQDRGQGPPRSVHTDTLAKIASALGVEPSELVKAS